MKQTGGKRSSIGKFLGIGLISLAMAALANCRHSANVPGPSQRALEIMSLSWQKNLLFEENFFQAFGQRNSIKTHFVPNVKLTLYQELFKRHSSEPDLVSIDVVWPGILAGDLLDLAPYLGDRAKDFPPQLLASYTVRGKLVALPLFIDIGVLYYRADLLAKYGFPEPPQTWEELERMAARIQQGERRAGKKDFWGYVWQGAQAEGGTCNALEWQTSAGAGSFLEPAGFVHVRSAAFAAALSRAVRWSGSISPPAEYVYWEDDSMNLWEAGQTAFMRNWASAYGQISESAKKSHRLFSIAPLPAGPGGHRGTLGGLGMGVSKYAANREMAIKAVLELTGESNDLARLLMTDGIPARLSVSERPDVKSRTQLLAVSTELMRGLAIRPSAVAGVKYDEASRAYSKAINLVLRRRKTPEEALAQLETELMRITGLPAQRD